MASVSLVRAVDCGQQVKRKTLIQCVGLAVLRGIVVVFSLIAYAFASPAIGQTGRAAITGTATDSSKRVVPGVEVTARNIETGAPTSTLTNSFGIYSIMNLEVGRYSLRFNKEGFKSIDFRDIFLNIDQVAKLNAELVVGLRTQVVRVSGMTPVLDKEASGIGTNMKGDTASDLPLNIYGGRAIESFAVAITPGYSPLSSPYSAVINGNQTFTKDFTVDGTSATAQIQGDSLEVGPTMEAVGELRSETAGLSVQNATTNGGVVMFNLRSGSNDFHGSAFSFGHNEILDANTFDNNRMELPKPKARFADWGFSAGGPLRKNTTFIFGAFERFTQNDYTLGGFGNASTVPTTQFLAGDFSALLDTTSQLGVDVHGNAIYRGAIFNPVEAGTVFVGNKIPSSMFSSVSQKIIALYQKGYAPQTSDGVQNDRIPSSNSPSQAPTQVVIKADQNYSEKDRFSASWIYNHRPRILADSGGVWASRTTDGGPLANARDQLVYAHEIRFSESHASRKNLLNVLNFTYNWYWNGSVPAAKGTNWPSALGFGSTGADNFPSINFGNSVNGFAETSIGNSWQGNYVGATAILGDDLSWTHGHHIVTVGGDWRAMEINSHAGSGALSFNFSNNSTGAPSQPYAGQVGFGFASFLLGDVQSASASTPFDLYGRRKALSLFAQDDYRVTSRVTLNLGLRWDATLRFHEKYGHWANFDLNAIDPNLAIPGAIIYVKNGSGSFERNEDWTNFGPRIGFAYSPGESWVVRGSLGMTFVPTGIQYDSGVPYGFAPGFRGTDNAAAPFNWDQGYPGQFTPGTMTSTPDPSLNPIATIDPDALTAGYTENWNLGTQYAVTKNTRVEVSYIANRGHRLQGSNLAYNEAAPGKFFDLVRSGNASVPVCDPSTAASVGVPYPFSGFCGPAFAAIAPYPQLAQGAAYIGYPNLYYVGLPLGQSFYDSMVVEVMKQSGNGVTMDMSYTLSRQLGDTFDNFGDSYEVALNGIQDLSNLKEAAHTLSPYDQKHVVKGYATYRLPFGNGHRLTTRYRVVNAMASGWTLSGLVTYASGPPLSFYSPNIYDYYPGWAAVYVNYNLADYKSRSFHPGDFAPPSGTSPPPGGDSYFPASVVSNPADGELGHGPSRISALRGFGMKSENASLLKYFRFGRDGRCALSIRLEFYNLFNRNTFANPNTTVGSPWFGYVTGSNDSPRQGQFGARFAW